MEKQVGDTEETTGRRRLDGLLDTFDRIFGDALNAKAIQRSTTPIFTLSWSLSSGGCMLRRKDVPSRGK